MNSKQWTPFTNMRCHYRNSLHSFKLIWDSFLEIHVFLCMYTSYVIYFRTLLTKIFYRLETTLIICFYWLTLDTVLGPFYKWRHLFLKNVRTPPTLLLGDFVIILCSVRHLLAYPPRKRWHPLWTALFEHVRASLPPLCQLAQSVEV